MTKSNGERGQPCLTPLVMGIHVSEGWPKKGDTATLERELPTKFLNHLGKPAFVITALTQSWSMLSKALAVSSRKRKWVWRLFMEP